MNRGKRIKHLEEMLDNAKIPYQESFTAEGLFRALNYPHTCPDWNSEIAVVVDKNTGLFNLRVDEIDFLYKGLKAKECFEIIKDYNKKRLKEEKENLLQRLEEIEDELELC